MEKSFKKPDREQCMLFPESIDDYVPENHLARFVVKVVDMLDIKPILKKYKGGGRSAYCPRMMISLLFYSYATGTFSSRKIEEQTYDSLSIKYIVGKFNPDHATISGFRKSFLPELNLIFMQIMQACADAGLITLKTVSVDGTKIHANASKHSALSYGHTKKLIKQCREEINQMLSIAENTDEKENELGIDVQKEIANREKQIRALENVKERIEKQEKEKYEKKMGKEGKKKAQFNVEDIEDKAQINLTDEQSKIMLVSKNSFEQCYNAQAAVDTDSQIIVYCGVTNEVNDKQQIEPAVEGLKETEKATNLKVNTLLADTGYCSKSNVQVCYEKGIEPLFAPGRQKHNNWLNEKISQAENRAININEQSDALEVMKHKLKTKEGHQVYALRKSTIEPTFGVIKQVMGFRQFSLRGLKNVKGEWLIVCCAYNLKKMHKLLGRKSPINSKKMLVNNIKFIILLVISFFSRKNSKICFQA